MTTLKEVFKSKDWVITKITNGIGTYRVDARRSYRIADKNHFFSEWGSKAYVNKLCVENYFKPVTEMKTFKN